MNLKNARISPNLVNLKIISRVMNLKISSHRISLKHRMPCGDVGDICHTIHRIPSDEHEGTYHIMNLKNAGIYPNFVNF